jgi:hypothetical protein
VLLGGAAVVATALAGCSVGDDGSASRPDGQDGQPGRGGDGPDGSGPTSAAQEADVRLLSAVLADQRRLLERVHRTARAHPSLRARLRSVLVAGTAHVDVLERAGPSHEAPARRPVRVPTSPVRAVDGLRAEVERAARDRLDDCLAASSGAFARLLASIAASLDQQAFILAAPR